MKNYFLFMFLLLVSTSSFAHKLNVFAFVEGDMVNVEGYFSDGIPARNAKVTVTDKEGNLLYEGRANEKGQHQFKSPGKQDLTIKINAGMGHVATYQLGANETGKPMKSTASTASTSSSASDVQAAVAEAIKPLAREIDELKQKTHTSDLVGGIGYILGIFGLYAFLKFRKESQNS